MIDYKHKRHAKDIRVELDNELRRIKDENPDEYYRLVKLILKEAEHE